MSRQAFILLFLTSLVTVRSALLAGQPPNVIIILTDDLGWADLSSYGARRIDTPQLDRMAAEGVRFTDYYAPTPVCSPSRAALLTGRYPFRTDISRVLHPNSKKGLKSSELTLAEAFQASGYRTGLFGKWHLGDRYRFLPLQSGFDEYFGIPYSNDMRPLLFLRGNSIVTDEIPIQSHLTRMYTASAVDFIERHRSEPFLLMISHSMPHYPIAVSGVWEGSSRDGVYGDVVQELDWSVGEILSTLRKLGLDQNTAVFFTSDNGSWRPRSNGKLRGAKASTWEGGIRVPFIARFPGVFKSNEVVSVPAMLFDLYPTCLDLAGVEIPDNIVIDGRSLLGLLEESPPPGDYRRDGDPLFFFNRGNLHAARAGRWKLHVARRSFLRKSHSIVYELYDLRTDPGETRNVADMHPKIVHSLIAIEESFRDQNSLTPVE